MTPPASAASGVDRPDEQVLHHVVVAAGTPAEWLQMSTDDWRDRLDALAFGGQVGGAHWVTLLPHSGEDLSVTELSRLLSALDGTGKTIAVGVGGVRRAWRRDDGITIIVDPVADGHERFTAAVRSLCVDGVAAERITEDALSRRVLAPAEAEVDLVVVLGRPDTLPSSMVWELGYSELVFLDLGWRELNAGHLELAIDDFNRRHRRFGGLDS